MVDRSTKGVELMRVMQRVGTNAHALASWLGNEKTDYKGRHFLGGECVDYQFMMFSSAQIAW